MLLSFLKFPFPVLRHRIFFRVSARFSFVYARQLVEEGVRQNPAFVQNGENVAKTGQIGDIVPPATPASPSAATSGSTTPSARAVTLSASSNAKYGCGFRNRLDDGWHRLHGSLTPLRLSQIVLIALRRFTARQDRFTLGLRLDECSFSPGVQKRNNFPEHPLTNHAIWHLILN